jgi:hypothetical protein
MILTDWTDVDSKDLDAWDTDPTAAMAISPDNFLFLGRARGKVTIMVR